MESTRLAREQLDSVLRQTQDFDQHIINGDVTVNDPVLGTQSEIKMGAEPFYFSDGQGHYYNSYVQLPGAAFIPLLPRDDEESEPIAVVSR